MELEKLNKVLANLQYPDRSILQFVERKDIHMGVSENSYGSEGVQGEEDSYYNIYKILSEDNLFLKIEIYTDSYGNGEAVRGAQIVKGVKKTVTIFEYE
jgi:hypothetical protein